MAKYLVQFSYSVDGLRGVLKDGGTARKQAVEAAIKSAGGTLESFYFAYGESDGYAICDFADEAACIATLVTIGASGAVNLKTTVLITPEQMDAGTKKAVAFRPPGT